MAAALVIATLSVIVFLVSCLYFLTKRNRSQSIEYITDPVTGRKKVRIIEGYFNRGKYDSLYILREAHFSNVVVIESPSLLKKTHLITALLALARKHPYLRM